MSTDYMINQGEKSNAEVKKSGEGKTYEDEKLYEGEILEVQQKFQPYLDFPLIRENIIYDKIKKIENDSNFTLIYSNYEEENSTWTYQVKFDPQFKTTGAGMTVAISLASIAFISYVGFKVMEFKWKIRNPVQNILDKALDWRLYAVIGGLLIYANTKK